MNINNVYDYVYDYEYDDERDYMPSITVLRRAYNRKVERLEDEGEEIPDFNDWVEQHL